MSDLESRRRERVIVRATWNRRFPGFSILAFADRSYVIYIGSDHKPPLVTIGWYRWHPDSIELGRWGLGPWPKDEPEVRSDR